MSRVTMPIAVVSVLFSYNVDLSTRSPGSCS